MKKLLVMGSNFGCVEIIEEARKRGYYIIVTDYYDAERSYAKTLSDENWELSTSETEKLAIKCREEYVDAAICGVSEFNSEMTFKLCDAAGLHKYCSWDAWEFTRNKRKFKEICKKHGVNVAADYDIEELISGEDETVNLPVVVKPIDCCANIGVSFCYAMEDLRPAYEKAREVTQCKNDIICEQMLKGREYAAAYALVDGKASLINLFAMHNEDGYSTNIYSLDITATGVLDIYLSEIDKGMKEVFADAKFGNGIVWVELMHNENDRHMYVLECGYRFPASMLPYTFKKVTGFDAVSWYLDSFMGIEHTIEDLPDSQSEEYTKYGVSYLLWNDEGGTIRSIEGLDSLRQDTRIDVVDCLRKPGYELSPHSIVAEVLFTANSRDEAIGIIESINDTVSIITEDGQDVLIRYTGFNKIA